MSGVQAIAFAQQNRDRVRSLAFATLDDEMAERKIRQMCHAIDTLGMASYADSYLQETLTTAITDDATNVCAPPSEESWLHPTRHRYKLVSA